MRRLAVLLAVVAAAAVGVFLWVHEAKPPWYKRILPWAEQKPAEFKLATGPADAGAVDIRVELTQKRENWTTSVDGPAQVQQGRLPLLARADRPIEGAS